MLQSRSSDAANYARGSITNKYKSNNGLGTIVTSLFQSGVCQILDYGSAKIGI